MLNKKFAAVALGALLSVGIGAAQAGELTEDQLPWNQHPVASSVTRAQVQAELRDYLNSTHTVLGEYPEIRVANVAAPEHGKTRAQVQAELRDYLNSTHTVLGEYPEIRVANVAAPEHGKTRAQVQAELRDYLNSTHTVPGEYLENRVANVATP
ncbi:MAG: hypothetical protein QM766_10390 [Burkholderiaceae bacterium]